MLPLSLLNGAKGHPILVELKDGESVNGHLVECDTWMNLILTNAIQTASDGEHFYHWQQCYIRGNNIKYLRLPDEVIDKIKDEQQTQQAARGGHSARGGHQHAGRGDRGDRGGRGGPRGGRGRGRGRGS